MVRTISFKLLYGLIILRQTRRRLVRIAVTANPTAEWMAGQVTEAFPWDEAPKHLIRDRAFGAAYTRRIRAMGIRDHPIAARSPWQNGHVERLIGSIRRECLDHVLAGSKLIAEAWDAAGLYQVGSFIGDSWKEWNGRFRDDVRSFFRGEQGLVGPMANRLLGSRDIYGHQEREAEQSVNFVACHDGFTLNDIVSYNRKHNESNGEDNRDGTDDNRSWNCGIEGPTDDAAVEALRNRQIKNFLTVTVLSIGVPMIPMGDEVRRTQRGNNNAYCLDNETNWLDWTLLEKHADVHRFVTLLNAGRALADVEHERARISLNQLLKRARQSFHGVKLDQPDWTYDSHSIAVYAQLANEGFELYAIMNAYWEPLNFELPPLGEIRRWRRWVDTSRESPEDIVPWHTAPSLSCKEYRAESRSVVVLFTESEPDRRSS